MSFNSGRGSGSEPHAYVSYEVDGEKDSFPISFIRKFPPQWREQGYNKKYLFKVFWSPDPDDSPMKMLCRIPEIPTFENTSLEKPGYYRAAVVSVAGKCVCRCCGFS